MILNDSQQKNHIMLKNIGKVLLFVLVVAIAAGTAGCKGEKKMTKKQAAKAYAAKVDNAKKDLTAIVNGTTTMSLAEQERKVANIKAMDLNDNDVKNLITQAEDKLAKDRSALNQKELEAKMAQEEAQKKPAPAQMKIEDYFSSIATAKSVSDANLMIGEALKLFSSPDALVLIIISKSGGTVDYDKPTTAKNYLNYLKDTRNNINKVDKVNYDANGKIKELELIKSY
jgi:hypothetical protein